jgi:hypothetical protein
MKNSHITTAIKALKRQLLKYQTERERFEVAEKTAKASKDFFTAEIEKINKQIASLEGTDKLNVAV